MKKKYRAALRTLCVILAFCLAAITAAPVASALTAEQEQALQSGQRSLNNPQGTFTVPRLDSSGLFHEDSFPAVQMVFHNVLRQFITANAKPEFSRIMAYAPLVIADDVLPPQKQLDRLGMVKALLEGMNHLYIALQETEQVNIYRVIAFFTNRKGEVFWTATGAVYDAESGFLMGADDTGLLGSGLEFDLDNFVARLSPGNTNKQFGFNVFFDILSPLALMFLETMRFPFEYNGKEYMIQFWKGSYFLISNGGEISIYERHLGRRLQWDASDTNNLAMTMQVYQKDQLFLDFGPYHTWWLGNFRFGSPFLLPVLSPKKLRLTGAITFEDPGMRDAFWASFQANKNDLFTGSMEDMVFSYDWQAG